MTPKQRVLKRHPAAKCKWIPGWGLYEVTDGLRQLSVGFNTPEAWRIAAKPLPSIRKYGVTAPVREMDFEPLVDYAKTQAELFFKLKAVWSGKWTKRDRLIYLEAFKDGVKCAAEDRIVRRK